jgi:predicted nucleic-acid-binding Zn-ribbon protein
MTNEIKCPKCGSNQVTADKKVLAEQKQLVAQY